MSLFRRRRKAFIDRHQYDYPPRRSDTRHGFGFGLGGGSTVGGSAAVIVIVLAGYLCRLVAVIGISTIAGLWAARQMGWLDPKAGTTSIEIAALPMALWGTALAVLFAVLHYVMKDR